MSKAKLVFALALVCGLVTLSACGGSDGDSDTGGSETASAKPSEVSGDITVWDAFYKLFPGYSKAVKPLDEAFEKAYPNVNVEHVAQGYEQYPALVRAAFTAREGPDVMMMLPSENGVLVFDEGLEELNDRITPEMQDQLLGWYTMTPGYTEDGPHFGVPIGLTDFIFYYNKELFKKAGLPTDFQPESWEELKEVGEKLKAAGIQPFNGGDKEGYEDLWWWMEAWPTVNTKEQAIELGEGKLPLTSEEFARAFEPLEMMEDAGLLEEDRFTKAFITEGYEEFSDGNGAMVLGGTTSVAYWAEFNEALGEENVGVFLPPNTEYVNAEPEFGWSIPKFAENKDAAWAYIEFMSSKEGLEILFEKGGLLPNRKDVELPASAPEQAKQIADWYENEPTFTTVAHVLPINVTLQFSAESKEYFQGRTTMEDMQQALQETFEKEKSKE